VRFLNASQAHLREDEQEKRLRQPLQVARASGASARIEERLDRFEASFREMQ
jgi:hypothetical protein